MHSDEPDGALIVPSRPNVSLERRRLRTVGQEGVETAVAQAREVFAECREQPTSVRGGALAQMADDMEERTEELAGLAVKKVGKPIMEAESAAARVSPAGLGRLAQVLYHYYFAAGCDLHREGGCRAAGTCR